MLDINWLEKNESLFKLPIFIDQDKFYYTDLENRYQRILSAVRVEDSAFYEKIKAACDSILSAIVNYYSGSFSCAYFTISKLIDEIEKDEKSEYAISTLKRNFIIPKNSKDEIQFFRARKSNAITRYEKEEMLHVPFDKRELCCDGRFSISGIPCLYIGNTSYVCWLEMGSPADHEFNVAPFKIDNNLTFLNLAIPINYLYSTLEHHQTNEFYFLMKIFLIQVAISYCIKEENRVFHSEYIISQLIMKICMEKKYDGIIYYSTKASSNIFNIVIGFNAVLFMPFDNESKNNISKKCDDHIENWHSYNFSMIKKLKYSETYKSDRCELAVDFSPFISNIGTIDYQIAYRDTFFYDFDKYIFSQWEESKKT